MGAGKDRFDGRRLGEVPVGRHARQRLGIEKPGSRRQAGVHVELGTKPPDEQRAAEVRERPCDRCRRAAVAIHRGIHPVDVPGGQQRVTRTEACQGNQQQQRNPDPATAEQRGSARCRQRQRRQEEKVVAGEEAESGGDSHQREAAPAGPQARGRWLPGFPAAPEVPAGGREQGDVKTGPVRGSHHCVPHGTIE